MTRKSRIDTTVSIHHIMEARSVLSYLATIKMGFSMTILTGEIGITVTTISGPVICVKKIVEEIGLKII